MAITGKGFAQSKKDFNPRELAISLVAVTNNYQNKNQALVTLEIKNNSKKNLAGTGWNLYFNSKNNLVLKSWENLTENLKNDKIIQILAYAFMFKNEIPDKPIEAGIISFKNLKAGFLPFTFKKEKEEKTIIDEELINAFIEEIVLLLNEILDKNQPFKEKI